MPSGGARPRSGPSPDPNALRRDRPSDKAEWIDLPASGRQGEVPEWPLARPTARELWLWAQVWKLPQAVMWEANQMFLEVAMYVRTQKDAEKSSATTSLRTLLKRQMDSLGLTEPGRLAYRWRIVDEQATDQAARPAARDGRPSAKDRLNGLTVIDGGG